MLKSKLLVATFLLSMATSATVLAGTWRQTESGWWYDNGDGTFPNNTWQWIDGNNDGVAECYYFYGNGIMAANTVTPDGYTVNPDGAWTVDGKVQAKHLNGQAPSSTGSANSQTQSSTSSNHQKTLQELYNENFANGTFIDYSNGSSSSVGGVNTNLTGVNTGSDDYDSSDVEVKSLEEYSESELYKMITGTYSSKNDPTTGYSNDEAIDAVVYLVNILRSKKGLNDVVADDTLMEAAQVRAEEASEKFSHTRPDGSDCFTALDEAGWPQDTHAAENLAQGQKTALQVVNAWYHSSGHKHNMLHEKNGTIGVGITGSGYSTTWSQFFSE